VRSDQSFPAPIYKEKNGTAQRPSLPEMNEFLLTQALRATRIEPRK
jgi:hypothetical protein